MKLPPPNRLLKQSLLLSLIVCLCLISVATASEPFVCGWNQIKDSSLPALTRAKRSALNVAEPEIAILIVRVQFANGEPLQLSKQAAADLFNRPDGIRDFYERTSYGKVKLRTSESDVTEVVEIPGTPDDYPPGSNSFREYVRNAIAGTHQEEDYQRTIYVHSHVSSIPESGAASLMGYALINGFEAWNLHTVAHEIGHTFGFGHAGRWIPAGTGPTSDGTSEEYGDPFDVMGSGLLEPNPIFRAQVGWLPPQNITRVTTAGSYRLYHFDHLTALEPEHNLALRIPRNGTRDYWLCYRNGGSYGNGVSVIWNYDAYLTPTYPPTFLLGLGSSPDYDSKLLMQVGETFTDPDTGTTWTIRAAGGSAPNEYFDVEVETGQQIGLAEALDIDSSFDVRTEGDKPWVGTTALSSDGVDACHSGDIGPWESSSLKISVQGPGVLGFNWRVSSELNEDYLRLSLDGFENGRLSGAWDWQPKLLTVPEGFHEVEWRYTKSGKTNAGGDRAWVDQVRFSTSPRKLSQVVHMQIPLPNDPPIPNFTFSKPFIVYAEASSSLPVSFSVLSGPAIVTGATIYPYGTGAVTLRASQAGNDQYDAAPAVEATFLVDAVPVTTLSADIPDMTVDIENGSFKTVRTACLQEDGKFIIGGYFHSAGGTTQAHLARFNQDGTFDQTWRPEIRTVGGNDQLGIYDMAIRDGFLYVCGSFDSVNGKANLPVAKINLGDGGSVSPDWNPPALGRINGLEVCSDGLLVHGDVTTLRKLAFETGALDPSWDPQPNGAIFGMSVLGENVYIAGSFTLLGQSGIEKKYMAKLSTAAGAAVDVGWTASGDYIGVTQIFLTASQTGLYAGGEWGSFSLGNSFAHIDLNDGHTIYLGVTFRSVTGIAANGASLYVGFGGNTTDYQNAFFVQRWDATTHEVDLNWRPHIISRIKDFNVLGSVRSISCRGNDVFLAGDFISAGASSGAGVALIPAIEGAPTITPGFTFLNQQSTTGLVIEPDFRDIPESAFFQISHVQNGTLFRGDGVTPVYNDSFITLQEARSGLQFRPTLDFVGNASFEVQAALRPIAIALGGSRTTASIAVSVGRLSQSISFTPIPSEAFNPAQPNRIHLNAQASSGLSPEFLLVSGSATIVGGDLLIHGPGPIQIQITQAGNDQYQPALAVVQTIMITKAPQSINFPEFSRVQYTNGLLDFDVTASSGLPIASYVVSGPALIDTGKLRLTGTGIVTIQASQPGNNVYEAAVGSINFEIVPADDFMPSISIDNATVTEGDDAETVNAYFTVSLSGVSSKMVAVNYATTSGSALAGNDYLTSSGTISFAPGTLSQVVAIRIVNDRIHEATESFQIDLTNPLNATIAQAQASGTIIDTDSLPVISIDDVTITKAESGISFAYFTVSLSRIGTETVELNFATADGSAVAGSDYLTLSGALLFPPGITNQVVAIPVIGDSTLESTETFLVNLSNPVNAIIGKGQALGTIVGQVSQPFFSIVDGTVMEEDHGVSYLNFEVRLSAASSETTTVDYATADGTAVSIADYLSASGTLSFPPGTTRQSFGIAVVGDLIQEPTETFFVNLSNSQNAGISKGQASATIVNYDPRLALSCDNVFINEGDSGTTNAIFTLSLSTARTETVTVDYATEDASALAGSDYIASSGTVTFPPGTTRQFVSIEVTGDSIVEPPTKTFLLRLSNPVNAKLPQAYGVCTIADNDFVAPPALPPTFLIDNQQAAEQDGALTIVFVVRLAEQSSQTQTVSYTTEDISALAGSDYIATSGTLTFPPFSSSQLLEVRLKNDSVHEPTETFRVKLSSTLNGKTSETQAICTIIDLDPLPTLAINDVVIAEGDSGEDYAEFKIKLSNETSETVRVDYSTKSGSASEGIDFVSTSGTLSFPPGTTIRSVLVPIEGDFISETTETFSMNLANPLNAMISRPHGTCTIRDNDPDPALTIDDVTIIEGDSGTTSAIFDVSLSAASGRTVSVDYITADISASAGSDYIASFGTVAFAPGITTQVVTIPVRGDLVAESTETFVVNLSNPEFALIRKGQGIGTILDTDPNPFLSIDDVTIIEGDSGTTSANFTLSLSAASGRPVSVDYSTSDGFAIAGTDYVANSGTAVFAPGSTSQVITISVTGDFVAEPTEAFSVNLSNPVNARISKGQGIGTIVDNDPRPAISIDNVTLVEPDIATINAIFTVSLSNPSSEAVAVSYFTAEASALANLDYVTSSGTIFFAPGQISQTLNIPVVGDSINEPSETFTVNLHNPIKGEIVKAQGTVTLLDNDFNVAPVLAFIPDTSVEFGTNLIIANSAHDGNSPEQTLTYSLKPGVPNGMSIDAQTGILNWTPTLDEVPGTNVITVIVVDNGNPPLSDEQSFRVVTKRSPLLLNIQFSGSLGRILVEVPSGITLTIEESLDLVTWTKISGDVTTTGNTVLLPISISMGDKHHYYRAFSEPRPE